MKRSFLQLTLFALCLVSDRGSRPHRRGFDERIHAWLHASAERSRSSARDGSGRHVRLSARRPRHVAGAGDVHRIHGARRLSRHHRRAACRSSKSASRWRWSCSAPSSPSASRRRLAVAMGVVGLFAVFHGHAHGTEMPLDASGAIYGAGFMLATALLHAAGVGIGFLIGMTSRTLGANVYRVAGGLASVAGVAAPRRIHLSLIVVATHLERRRCTAPFFCARRSGEIPLPCKSSFQCKATWLSLGR